jgi:hypothetical protein
MTPRIEEKINRFQIVALEERIAPSLVSITLGGSLTIGSKDGGEDCDQSCHKPRECEPKCDPCHEPKCDPCPDPCKAR